MKKPWLILFGLIAACSDGEHSTTKAFNQGYQDARKMGFTDKDECILTMIGASPSQLEGCLQYVDEFIHKARRFGDTEINTHEDALNAAPEEGSEAEEDADECLVSEGDATYITECNTFMKAE